MPPTYVTGDLWQELGRADLILVTTNAVVSRSGRLVMGKGAAYEAAALFPTLSTTAGIAIQNVRMAQGEGQPYGVKYWPLPSTIHGERHFFVGIFQVKWDWRQPASLSLIRHSVLDLVRIAHSRKRIALNYPGTGNGHLSPRAVAPLLEPLPDHVFIYSKEK